MKFAATLATFPISLIEGSLEAIEYPLVLLYYVLALVAIKSSAA